jgi:hypothetical protein
MQSIKAAAIVLLVLMGMASCTVALFDSHTEDGAQPIK